MGSVFIDNEKANKAIDDTDKKGKGLGDRLGSMIGTAAKVGAGIAAGVAIAFGGLLALANNTAAAADEIDKLSERTGINREELQRWRYAAGQSGADVGKLEVGIKKLSDVMDGAAKGNKANVAAFEQLGISLTDTSGKVKSTEAVFTDVMAALGDMEQGAARNALGNDLLGKSYTEMLPLLNAGSEGMDALKNRADELGLVMSEDAVKANVKFGDTMDDLKQSFGAVFMHISNAVLPVLQLFIDSILENMPQIKAIFSAVFSAISFLMSGFVDGIKVVIGWLKQWGNDNQEIANVVQGYFTALFNLLKTLFEVFVAVATAIWSVYGDSIMSVAKFVWDVVGTVLKTSLKLMTDLFNIFSALFRGDWEALWNGVRSFFNNAWQGIHGVLKSIINLMIRALNGAYKNFFQAGKDLILGLWDGLSSMGEWLQQRVTEFIRDDLIGTIKRALGIASPSKVMALIGEQAAEGLAAGLQAASGKVREQAEKLIGDMVGKVQEMADQYSAKVKQFLEQVQQQEKQITETYQRELNTRASALYAWVGIFDEAPKKMEIAGRELLQNLKGQVEYFRDWQSQVATLSRKAVDEGLIKELQQMGPKALPQIQALNLMTGSELEQYVALWQQKHEMAKDQAIGELDGLKQETELKVKELRQKTNEQLKQYAADFIGKMVEIKNNSLRSLGEMAQKGVVIGSNLIQNIIQGISSQAGELKRSIDSISDMMSILPGGAIPSVSLSLPALANGGNVRDDGAFLVGERGPEILSGMKGATVTPLSKAGNTTTTIYMTVYGNWEEIRRELDAAGVVIA